MFIADGHHRLYATSMSKIKNHVGIINEMDHKVDILPTIEY